MKKSDAITYTNRKGKTYYLGEKKTKTGKKRFVFSKEPTGKPVIELPKGFEITESVNGVVSLSKAVPSPILPSEVDTVRNALAAHSHLSRHRVDSKKKDIIVYEPIGGDPDRIAEALGVHVSALKVLEDSAQYTPVLRFRLLDEKSREFSVERMCYRGSIDGWLQLSDGGEIERLARRYVGHLGKESFFELI
jgi:hypothetical protein